MHVNFRQAENGDEDFELRTAEVNLLMEQTLIILFWEAEALHIILSVFLFSGI